MEPKEITKDTDDGLEVASFEFYTGQAYAKEKGLIQATNFADVSKGTHFIVCCGDVMVKVESEDFPNIERRLL